MNRLLIICLLLAPAAFVRGAGPESDTFDRLYGKEMAAARASHDPQVKAKFSETLIDAADGLTADPDLQAQVYSHAFDLGMLAPAAYPMAQEAMELLAAAQPQRKQETDVKLLAVLARQFQAASGNEKKAMAAPYLSQLCSVAEEQAQRGELTEAIKTYGGASAPAAMVAAKAHQAITARMTALRMIDADERRLQKTPDAKLAAEVGLAVAIELNRPADGAKIYPAGGTAAPMLAMAAKGIDALTEAQSITLGDWYASMTEQRTEFGRMNALGQAAACYAHWLSAHPAADAQRARMEIVAKKTNDDLNSIKTAISFGAAVSTATVTVVSANDWATRYLPAFPEQNNLASKGAATATNDGTGAATTLTNKRGELGWWPAVSGATYDAAWKKPVIGRFILVMTDGNFDGIHGWKAGSTVSVNGQPAQPLPEVRAKSVVIIDMGCQTLIRDISMQLIRIGQGASLLHLEIHRSAISTGAKS